MKSQPCADKLTQGCVRHLKLQNRTVEEFQETPAKCQNTTKKIIRRKQHSCRLSEKGHQRSDLVEWVNQIPKERWWRTQTMWRFPLNLTAPKAPRLHRDAPKRPGVKNTVNSN